MKLDLISSLFHNWYMFHNWFTSLTLFVDLKMNAAYSQSNTRSKHRSVFGCLLSTVWNCADPTSGNPPMRSAIVVPDTPITEPHHVIFDKIDGDLRTEGAAGPSGLDSTAWRRMCTSFKSASTDLCDALATMARRICRTIDNIWRVENQSGLTPNWMREIV